MDPAPLLAWSPFGAALMLMWGVFALAPFLIHLWNQRNYKREAWAASEYLLAAMKKNARRLQIEQLILLLVRTAILLLFPIALAQPGCDSAGGVGGEGGVAAVHRVIVIDGSYSMDARQGDTTRFEVAKQRAESIIAAANEGDGYSVVLMSDPPHVVIGDPAYAAADVRAEIDALEFRHAGADVTTTLARVEEIFSAAAKDHMRLQRREAFFISDMDAAAWEAAASEEFRARTGRLAEQAELRVVDVGDDLNSNVAITSVAPNRPLLTLSESGLLTVEVTNFSSQQQTGRTVSLYIDAAKSSASRPVDLPPEGRATAVFPIRFEQPGDHRLEVRLDNDSLPLDDRRLAVVSVRESIRVLCVEGKYGAARHMALALEPSGAGPRRVRVETVSEGALLELQLEDYDSVFLCNVGRIGADEAAVLRDFVRLGRGLAFFLGDRVQADSYNEHLAGDEETRLLPAHIGEIADTEDYRFDPLEYRHPIVAPFRGHENAGLLTTPVWRFFRVAPIEPAASRVALAFGDGSPAIVEERRLGGRVVLYASAVSPLSLDRSKEPPTPWTAISSWPSFPPLMQRVLDTSLSASAGSRQALVGQTIGAPLPGGSANRSVTITTPDGAEIRAARREEGDILRWSFDRTWESGAYLATFSPSSNTKQWFAVNLDTRESDLARFDLDELPSQMRLLSGDDDDQSLEGVETAQRMELFRLFLAIVLGLLLMESTLACVFGRWA